MPTTSFLDHVSQIIFDKHQDDFANLVIILPNKRAKVFLLDALNKKVQKDFFAPKIISIEQFIQDISGVRAIDPIELLFEFYELYLDITDKNEVQNFEAFSNWANTLLSDFNEIDRYLLEPNRVFLYLKEIEAIKRWNLEAKDKTVLIDNYLKFWDVMPVYYQSFYEKLVAKDVGYQGLIYREAVRNLEHFSVTTADQHFIFAGFNALNQAEEKIIQHLLSEEKASVYWDVEETFLLDTYHDAGLFARKIKNSWSYYKSHPYEWIFNEYKRDKNIQIIGTPKTVGQAKIAGSIIKDVLFNNPNEKVAIVLGEEGLLIPMLHSLPKEVAHLNITMGYSSKNNPAQLLINRLFKLHTNALSRKGTTYVFYYKDVLDVLNNPLIEPFANAKQVVEIMNRNNYSFISQQKLLSLQEHPNELFDLLFLKWETTTSNLLDRLSAILVLLKGYLGKDAQEEKIAKTFVYSIFKVINKLINYTATNSPIENPETLYTIYKQVVELAEVAFEGEPLQGLQIMGVLESRVLDFDTVIITSMNEGTFPAGKTQNSFIPYDVKRELGLPTFKEKDAIYTYHFYHILQRAKNVFLLYNTETEGIDAGEKSRFITQIEVEQQSNHNVSHEIYNAEIPEVAYERIVVEKSDAVMKRLMEIAASGFSPSSLLAYIRNPMQFYYQRLLRISDQEEVEENVAVNTLGTIIHATLEELYKPYLEEYLTASTIELMLRNVDEEVFRQFKIEYKEGEITKGKNLLAFEVAKRNIYNFLKGEQKAIETGDIVKILALEKEFKVSMVVDGLAFPVFIKGNIDRIEERNGVIRIIDYKTGKVEQNNLSLTSWEGLTTDIKNDKKIQLLCYYLMVEKDFPNKEIQVGIISFKNLRTGFMPFQIKEGREVITNTVNETIKAEFLNELSRLINEIMNKEQAFEETL